MKVRTHSYLSIIVLVAMMGMTVACNQIPNDSKISSELQDKINTDSGLQGKQLSVQSDKGTVTLSGTVDNEAQRDAAARYASGIPGVKQVVNNLSIGAATTAAAAAPADPAPTPVDTPKPAPAVRREPAPRRRTSVKRDVEMASAGAGAGSAGMAMAHQDSTPAPPPLLLRHHLHRLHRKRSLFRQARPWRYGWSTLSTQKEISPGKRSGQP